MSKKKTIEEKEVRKFKEKNAQKATGGVLIALWTFMFFFLIAKYEEFDLGVISTLVWLIIIMAIAFASGWTERR